MLCTWRCQTGPFPPQPTPSAFCGLGGWEEPTGWPPRADAGFLSSCDWAGLPVGAEQLSRWLLLRQRGIRAPVGSWGRVPPRTCGDPSTRGMAQTSHHQHSSNLPTPLADPRGSQQARPCPPQPVPMATSLSEARAGEAQDCMGQRGPELPVLGSLLHPSSPVSCLGVWRACLVGARLCPCSGGPGLGCRGRAPSRSLRH